MIEVIDEYRLEKTLWTESDFEEMGWHDSFIYGITLGNNYELIFDIDYIFKWVAPVGERKHFKFWISPCTLVFENVHKLVFNLEIDEPFELEISDINRTNPQTPRKIESGEVRFEHDWVIHLQHGEINFKSVGFKQYVRRNPILLNDLRIGRDERGEVSFARQ